MVNHYSLSVVIPVSGDIRIRECLASLPEGIEIVIVLNNNPSLEVTQIVKADPRCHLVISEGTGCNLARVFNIGIVAAGSERVMLLDPDCIVPPGLVEAASKALAQFDVAKARVFFASNSPTTKLVASVRWLYHHVFNDGRNLYSPGLAFRKSIASKIGGYYFDERMGWGTDGELSVRILNSGLSVCYLEQEVNHGPETIRHDLKVAFQIGRGERCYDQSQGFLVKSALWRDLLNTLLDRRGRFRLAWRRAGIPFAVYFLLWKAVNRMGYYTGR